MRPENSQTASIRVASVDSLARVTTGTALMLGVGVVAVTVLSGFGGLAVCLSLLFLVSLLGSAAYVGARRTVDATSVEVEGDRVVAQGVGRGGHGFLGGHVVAVTDTSVRSISVAPWGVGRVADAIPFAQIGNVEGGGSFLRIDGGGQGAITLKACPPPQVEALLDEIRLRTVSDDRSSTN
jgi:hypothetical protein